MDISFNDEYNNIIIYKLKKTYLLKQNQRLDEIFHTQLFFYFPLKVTLKGKYFNDISKRIKEQ